MKKKFILGMTALFLSTTVMAAATTVKPAIEINARTKSIEEVSKKALEASKSAAKEVKVTSARKQLEAIPEIKALDARQQTSIAYMLVSEGDAAISKVVDIVLANEKAKKTGDASIKEAADLTPYVSKLSAATTKGTKNNFSLNATEMADIKAAMIKTNALSSDIMNTFSTESRVAYNRVNRKALENYSKMSESDSGIIAEEAFYLGIKEQIAAEQPNLSETQLKDAVMKRIRELKDCV